MNPIRTGGRAEHFLTRLAAMILVLGSGCDAVTAPLAEALKDSKSDSGNVAQKDVFAQAMDENPKDRLYLEAARPVLSSIASRDWPLITASRAHPFEALGSGPQGVPPRFANRCRSAHYTGLSQQASIAAGHVRTVSEV
jgi:hypothetical protein